MSNPGDESNLTPAPPAARPWTHSVLAYVILVETAIFIFALYHSQAVGDFYATHIAHYDSVGTLLWATQTINAYDSGGYGAALAHAWDLPPLSLTQNMFVGFASPFLKPVPASIQIYNVVAIGLAICVIGFAAHRFRLSVWAAALAIGALFLPDILYYWNLGIFDYRRETGFYGFLVSAMTFGAAINIAPRPGRALPEGVVLGVLCGLFLLSRDNAALVGIGLLFVPIAAFWGWALLKGDRPSTLRQIIGTVIGFLPFGIVFLVRLNDILARLLDPSTMYANNGDRIASFMGNIMSPVRALFGGDTYLFNLLPMTTIILFGIVAVLTLGAYLSRFAIRGERSGDAESANAVETAGWIPFIALFIWPIIYMHLMLSFVTGWLPGQNLIAGLAPYVPACSGIVFLGLWVAGKIDGAPFRIGKIAATTAAVLIMFSVALRAESRMITYPPQMFSAHAYLSSLTSPSGGAPVFAELADSDLRVPAITLLAAMNKRPEPKRLKFATPDGKSYDMQIATPSADQIPTFLTALERASLCDADYILLNDGVSHYSDASSPLFLRSSGAPLYESLLAKLADSPQHKLFISGEQAVIVIDNTGRKACS